MNSIRSKHPQSLNIQEPEHLQFIIEVLSKPLRSKLDVDCLMQAFSSLRFFDQQRQQLTPYLFNQLFRHIQLQQVAKYDSVFNYGDIGSTFYIILSGEVVVLLPKSTTQDELQNQQRTVEEINQDVFIRRMTLINMDQQEFINQVYKDFVKVRTLKAGDSFGEVALIMRSNRTATILCTRDTDLMVLQKQGFDQVLGEQLKREIRTKVYFLQQIEYFSNVPEEHLTKLTHQVIEIHPKLNEVLYVENQQPKLVYLIWQGEIELSQQVTNRQRILISLLTPGAIFGEQEVLQNIDRRFKAVCKSTDTVLLTIGANQFTQLLEQYKLLESCQKVANRTSKRRLKDMLIRRKATENVLQLSPSKEVSADHRFHSHRQSMLQMHKELYKPITNTNSLFPIEMPSHIRKPSSYKSTHFKTHQSTLSTFEKLKKLLTADQELLAKEKETNALINLSNSSRILTSFQFYSTEGSVPKPTLKPQHQSKN